jgi:conjugal transfer pilus assembly protein TraB
VANKLSAWYENLKPTAKKRIWTSAFLGGVVMVAVLFVVARQGQLKPLGTVQKEPGKKSVNINSGLLEKTVTADLGDTKKRLATLEQINAENLKTGLNGAAIMPGRSTSRTPNNIPKAVLTQTIDRVIASRQNSGTNQQPNQSAAAAPHTPMPAQPKPGSSKTKFNTPAPPGESTGDNYQDGKSVKWTYAGKIESGENKSAKKSAEPGSNAEPSDSKKKEKRIVHLPVSFMAAQTLNGLLVPATSDGKGDPYPLIVRVSTPAQLPNGILSQLSACFVVTEAIGSLQQSRALVRVVSLTCLDKKGEALIETDVRGFVEDADGKPGLAGIVSAPKFGEMVRLSAAAGFFSGVGDGMALSSASNTLSAVGPVASYGTSAQDIGIAAAGKGISGATKKINEVYADLLHQSLPCVEVGNGKKITVWITKGVDIEIKNFKNVSWY